MKIITIITFALIKLVAFTTPVSAYEKIDKGKINELFNYCFENDLFYGSALIAENGTVLYKDVYGYANIDTKEKLTLNTPSCIGSVSKQFTAMAVMILVEQNKLSYDDKLEKYFPELPGSDRISIRHLLNHTSGMLRYTTLVELRDNNNIQDNLINTDVIDALINRDSLNIEPGTSYGYTNSEYIILATIIERVSGEPFHAFMKRHIFNPLGMNNTFVRNNTKPETQNKANGYNQLGELSDYNVLLTGAGGIYSTVEDLFKWDQSLYTEKLVSQKTLKEAFTPGVLNNGSPSRLLSDSTWGYGFGWLLRKNDSLNIVWHDGGFNAFSAILYSELNNQLSIIMLVNKGGSGLSSPIYPVRDALLRIIAGETFEFPKIPIFTTIKNAIDDLGLEEAIDKYHQIKNTQSTNYDMSERQLNLLGYYFIGKGRLTEAIATLKLNVEAFPNSANTYDSLAEAYKMNGQKELSIINYEKSLEINPENTNARAMLNELGK